MCNYDARTGKLTYASAGHPAAVLVREGAARFLSVEPDLAAGIRTGIAPPSESVELRGGDLVVFYTDGVTEAFNAAGTSTENRNCWRSWRVSPVEAPLRPPRHCWAAFAHTLAIIHSQTTSPSWP